MLSRLSRTTLAKRTIQATSRRLQSTTPPPVSEPSSYPQHYVVPHIESINKFKSSGIPGLLSRQGLDNAYFSRAKLYADRLNAEITKLSLGGSAALEVVVEESALNSKHLKVFQNASLLHNVAFAMSCIGEVREQNPELGVFKPDEGDFLKSPNLSLGIPNVPTNEELSKCLTTDFGSLIEFKTLLINSARAIDGDGFTWLVARDNKYFKQRSLQSNDTEPTFDKLFILNTYNAGSPRNNDRIGQLDELEEKLRHKNASVSDSIELSRSIIPSFDEAEFSRFKLIKYVPLLAIDASPKAWLHDYGVFGKQQYLEQVWKAIDWDIVSSRLPAQNFNVL